MNFKGKLRIITKKGPNKVKGTFRKIFNMTTLKFVKGVIVTITSLKVQQYFVELYLKFVGKQVQGDKFEAHFNN